MMSNPLSSSLPDWLWPMEDDEAVLEAERLIEETHRALQKIESNILCQDNERDKFIVKTEKMKSSVMNKLHSLEEGLKDISKLSDTHQPNPSNHTFKTKGDSRCLCQKEIPQEKVVLTARDKIQDALQVARSVSASLSHHATSSSAPAKSASSLKATNVGIFEVKSQREANKEESVQTRLVQSQVSSVSIKRNLECQSIPAVYLPPTEKPVPHNVALCVVQHQDGDQNKAEFNFAPPDKYKKPLNLEKEKFDTNENLRGESSVLDIAELSRQLAQMEELRELNQAQVNHVLRFLVSKVTALTNTHPALGQSHSSSTTGNVLKKEVNFVKTETSPTSQSSSSSDCSRPKIAYDSLSRFLETYRVAAHQAMIAGKKAALRRKKVAMKQQKDIENGKRSCANHLLLGPLRPSETQILMQSKDDIMKPEKPLCETDVMKPCDSSKPCLEGVENNIYAVDSHCEEEKSHDDSLLMKSGSIMFSSTTSASDSQEAHVSKTTGDDYEDDWEEEALQESPKVGRVQADSSSLKTTSEVEEQPFSSHFRKESEPTSLAPDSDQHMVTPIPQPVASEVTHEVVQPLIVSLESADPQCFEKNTSPESINIVPDVTPRKFCDETTSDDVSVPKNGEHRPPLASASRHKRAQMSRQMSRVRQFSTSSSDVDDVCPYQRTAPRMKSRFDLKLADDLHLRSSTLHWQLEDHVQGTLSGEPSQLDHKDFSTQFNQSTVLTDVEERWKKALNELDNRIRAMEEHENVTRLLQKLNTRTREEQTQTSPPSKLRNDSSEFRPGCNDSFLHVGEQRPSVSKRICTEEVVVHSQGTHNLESSLQVGNSMMASLNAGMIQIEAGRSIKIPSWTEHNTENIRGPSSEDKMVQCQFGESMTIAPERTVQATDLRLKDQEQGNHTSKDFSLDLWRIPRPELIFKCAKEKERLSRFIHDGDKASSLSHRLWHASKRDLTDDLLAYSRMGVFSKSEVAEHSCAASFSSSTSSSLHLNSNFRVSLSDGEMLTNGSASCSCSEGEVCLCPNAKGEKCVQVPINLIDCFKDVSQGEIPISDGDLLIKDSSQGEIAFRSYAEETPLGDDLSTGSDADDTEEAKNAGA